MSREDPPNAAKDTKGPGEAMGHQSVVLDATLALSETQLLAQIADETSSDGRTMGLLAFNGALLAADIAARGLLGGWWWAPLPFLAIATALCLWSTFARNTDLGPRALSFYAAYSGLPAAAVRLQLLADLDSAFAENAARVRRKGTLLRWALGILTLGLVLAALLIALDRPTKVTADATFSTGPAATVRSPRPAGAFPADAGSDADPGTVTGAACRSWWASQEVVGRLRRATPALEGRRCMPARFAEPRQNGAILSEVTMNPDCDLGVSR